MNACVSILELPSMLFLLHCESLLPLQARGSSPIHLEDMEDEDVCAECGDVGELLMCDSCPLVYHLGCLDPPLSKVPAGSWLCPKCVRGFQAH